MVANDPGYRDEKVAIGQLRAALPSFVTTMVVSQRSGEPRPRTSISGATSRARESASNRAFRPSCLVWKTRVPGLRQIAWTWRAGWSTAESADGPGRREPDLASVLRPRTRRDRQRLWHARDAAAPSRAARLAGLRARRPGLELQGDSSTDRVLGHVSAGVDGAARGTGDRSRQSLALAAVASASRRRAHSRRRPDVSRSAHAHAWAARAFFRPSPTA